MTNSYRIIACVARLWLCAVALLMLHAVNTFPPQRLLEMLYGYGIWSLPALLVLLLGGPCARSAAWRWLAGSTRRMN